MRHLFTLLTGLVFGIGMSISGMMDPAKVLNFFDVAGAWDPSLAFVMGGALLAAFVGYRVVWRRSAPLFEPRYHLPSSTVIDWRLVGGSAVFGIGWGIAGFCPGGALPALGTGRWEVALFVLAVIGGFVLRRGFDRALTIQKRTLGKEMS